MLGDASGMQGREEDAVRPAQAGSRAGSEGLRGLGKVGRYAALPCPLKALPRGCAQAGAAAV